MTHERKIQEEEFKKELQEKYNDVVDTKELQEQYEVLGFQWGFVVVIRKADNLKGAMEFSHMPRFYFNFMKE